MAKKYNQGVADANRRRTKHGQARRDTGTTQLYRVWHSMKDRCLNPRCAAYHRYGGRGITVCQAWHDFTAFAKDMGERPSNKHTLERIDNSKGYEPDNVRWATRKEQANNRDTCVILEHDGKRMNIMQWAEHLKIGHATIVRRISRGDPIERVLRPQTNRKRNKGVRYKGKTQSLRDWERELGIPYQTLWWRFKTTGTLD